VKDLLFGFPTLTMMHLRIMLNMYWMILQLSPFHSASSDYQNKLLASLQITGNVLQSIRGS